MATSKDTNISVKRDYLSIPPIPDSVWQNPIHFIAFGFGVGIIPFAPGTFGSLMAIPFYLLLQSLSPVWYAIIAGSLIVACIWICDKTSRDIGIDDHQGMCLDEVAGMLVALFQVPHGWRWIAFAFVLFRLFDIWKPWPIRFVDNHIHGGFGMILDDVLAGVASCVIVQGVAHYLM